MRKISIDSMVLQVPGLPEFEAKRLALEITRGLAGEQVEGGKHKVSAVKVEAPAQAMENTSGLARRVVAEILREIRRAP